MSGWKRHAAIIWDSITEQQKLRMRNSCCTRRGRLSSPALKTREAGLKSIYNPGMTDISAIAQALREEKTRIENAISALEGDSSKQRARAQSGNGRRKRGGRRLSAAARRRISQAAKARWAAVKKAGKNKL